MLVPRRVPHLSPSYFAVLKPSANSTTKVDPGSLLLDFLPFIACVLHVEKIQGNHRPPKMNQCPQKMDHSKKSPTGPTEWTPEPEYLIALATYLGSVGKVPFNFCWNHVTKGNDSSSNQGISLALRGSSVCCQNYKEVLRVLQIA